MTVEGKGRKKEGREEKAGGTGARRSEKEKKIDMTWLDSMWHSGTYLASA